MPIHNTAKTVRRVT